MSWLNYFNQLVEIAVVPSLYQGLSHSLAGAICLVNPWRWPLSARQLRAVTRVSETERGLERSDTLLFQFGPCPRCTPIISIECFTCFLVASAFVCWKHVYVCVFLMPCCELISHSEECPVVHANTRLGLFPFPSYRWGKTVINLFHISILHVFCPLEYTCSFLQTHSWNHVFTTPLCELAR